MISTARYHGFTQDVRRDATQNETKVRGWLAEVLDRNGLSVRNKREVPLGSRHADRVNALAVARLEIGRLGNPKPTDSPIWKNSSSQRPPGRPCGLTAQSLPPGK